MIDRLHADEARVDEFLVRRLLADQIPALASLPLRPVQRQGTDNVVFRLGPDLCVRLPRKPSAAAALLVEQAWLPRLAADLPLAVPVPIALGEASTDYPFPWTVCRWLRGSQLGPGRQLDSSCVTELAGFAVALHAVPKEGGPSVPPGQRGGPLHAYTPVALTALQATADLQQRGRIERQLLDRRRAAAVWQRAVEAEAWHAPEVWTHRDLIGANLLVADDRLSGVIDFGGLALGDPAADLMGAFHVIRPQDRKRFGALVGADEAMWARARGWALTQALEALPYYLDTHPGMVAMARHVLAAVLAD